MNDTERPEPAADAVDVDRLGSILRMEYARGYQDAKKEGQVRTFSSTSVNDAALQAAAVEPEPGLSLDEMLDDVEAAFVSILWREDVGRHEVVMHGHSSAWFARGTGATPAEALGNAVRQAKENGDG